MSDIVLHPGQSLIYKDLFVDKTVQHGVAVCSRGFGKSFLGAASGVTAVFELMQLDASVPNKNVYIIAPSYAQVTDVYYPLIIYQMDIMKYCIKASKDTGRLLFPRNVELKLLSFEAIERVRGTGAYFVLNDETRDWTTGDGFKGAWENVLGPCIATRWSPRQALEYGAPSPGRSLTISTPKGYDFLYEMSIRHELDNRYKTYQFDHTQSPLLDQEEIERIRQTTDPVSFAREYGASFKDSGNTIFYCFDRTLHVKSDIEYIRLGGTDEKGIFTKGEDVHVCIDFNVMMQASSVFTVRSKLVHFHDEFSGSADTETLALTIKAKYWPNFNNKGHPDFGKKVCNIFVYPDPSGRSRKTSAPVGQTDFTILQSHLFDTRAHNAHPSIVDSVACVNRLLKTASGAVSLYIHPRCVGLIKSLERTIWVDRNPDTATIDKKEGVEHFSDGVRYGMEYLFPIQAGTKSTSRGFGF